MVNEDIERELSRYGFTVKRFDNKTGYILVESIHGSFSMGDIARAMLVFRNHGLLMGRDFKVDYGTRKYFEVFGK